MTTEAIDNQELTSSIAHHGAYIWETKRILETYIKEQSYIAVQEAVSEDNLLRKSSDSYRESILSEITRRYEINKNRFTETSLVRVFNRPIGESLRDWILYYEFSQDPIIALLTTEFLYPEYHSGALSIQKEDVAEFIEQIESEYPAISSWSDNTRTRVAEHYLAAMKNFGLLEGNTQKEFKYVFLPDELVLYVLYSLLEDDVKTAEAVVEHRDWKLLLMDTEEVRDRLHDLSPSHVRYEKRGSVERLEPKYESLKECIDEF